MNPIIGTNGKECINCGAMHGELLKKFCPKCAKSLTLNQKIEADRKWRSNETNHTATPWEVDVMGYLRGPKNENILEHKENAEFVCRAVNSHEALLEAAKRVVAMIDDNEAVEILEAAIAQVEGVKP